MIPDHKMILNQKRSQEEIKIRMSWTQVTGSSCQGYNFITTKSIRNFASQINFRKKEEKLKNYTDLKLFSINETNKCKQELKSIREKQENGS